MIFVTLGSQKFQFNRLLKEIDRLIEAGIIREEVFAQIGYSDYTPRNFKCKKFLGREEFISTMNSCDKVITHGGTGAIVGALKQNKKVIAVARLAKYGEHVDNHQLQLMKQFDSMNLICSCEDCDQLEEAVKNIDNMNFNKYISNTNTIINSLIEFIEEI
ncbi:EpsH protein [Terrisporobacter othiniensis]|uniref:EpsH protein n=1 Tax=Terrisporobacter othiniensis TaxID=1577792 RepID=A0A0B3W5X2_9FIRM|nr:PssE/Cps14G family polysaccharide biosynthesis glycosyltransferase [Terrisporobacter othiniensis]KHS57782.1 EpsH protein [Terrisporobacter othiniensis]